MGCMFLEYDLEIFDPCRYFRPKKKEVIMYKEKEVLLLLSAYGKHISERFHDRTHKSPFAWLEHRKKNE